MKVSSETGTIKVVHIGPTPFFADRGCHIRIRNEIESLNDLDVDPILCTYHHGRNIPSIKTFRIWRIPGYTNCSVGFSPYKLPADFFLFFLVLRVCFKYKPAVVHGHLHEGALIGWMVKILLFWRKMPLVMDVQGSLYGELKAYKTFQKVPFVLNLFKIIEKFIYLLPDIFFCSSKKSKETLRKNFNVPPEKLFLLEDVVADDSIFSDDKKQVVNIPSGKKTVVYSGSLLSGKGVEDLQEAMLSLLPRANDIFFLIIGYPVADMEMFVKENDFSSQCQLTGQLPYEQLLGCLALADIAIEPKMSESGEASGKVLHYMAASLPVVCFNTDNNVSLLGEAGYYAEKPTGNSLAVSVVTALSNFQEVERKGKIGKKLIEDRYSPNNCGQFLLQKYSHLITSL